MVPLAHILFISDHTARCAPSAVRHGVAMLKDKKRRLVDLHCDSPGHVLASYGSVRQRPPDCGRGAPMGPASAPRTPALRIAAAVFAYGALSIGMTLVFKRALSLFAYPCLLVAATFAVEAAAVRAWSGAPVHGDGNGRSLFLIACCVGGEVALSNAGLMLLSVAAHTMIKACTPVFVLLAALVLKLEAPSWTALAIVATISLGTALCSVGRHGADDSRRAAAAQALGAGLTVAAGAVGGLRWGLTQLATQKAATVVRPKELVARTLPWSAAFLGVVAAALDAPRLWSDAASERLDDLGPDLFGHVALLSLLLALGGLCLLRVEVTLVSMTSSLSLSIAAVAKELLLVVVSVAGLGDSISRLNAAGFALTGCGVVAYNAYKLARPAGDASPAPPSLLRATSAAYRRVPVDDAAAPLDVEAAGAGPPLDAAASL